MYTATKAMEIAIEEAENMECIRSFHAMRILSSSVYIYKMASDKGLIGLPLAIHLQQWLRGEGKAVNWN